MNVVLTVAAAHAPASSGLSILHWLALMRIALGLWWLESWRHKNKEAWLKKGSGIAWAQSVAEKHKWPVVKKGFDVVVAPRRQAMAYVIVFGELALGLGIALGVLTPVALVFSILLNLTYFVLMINDWAEQGQNAMMVALAVGCLGTHAWQTWSLGHLVHLF